MTSVSPTRPRPCWSVLLRTYSSWPCARPPPASFQVGTLFDLARLCLRHAQNLALQTAARRRSRAFAHPRPAAAARDIARTLGGEGRSLGPLRCGSVGERAWVGCSRAPDPFFRDATDETSMRTRTRRHGHETCHAPAERYLESKHEHDGRHCDASRQPAAHAVDLDAAPLLPRALPCSTCPYSSPPMRAPPRRTPRDGAFEAFPCARARPGGFIQVVSAGTHQPQASSFPVRPTGQLRWRLCEQFGCFCRFCGGTEICVLATLSNEIPSAYKMPDIIPLARSDNTRARFRVAHSG